MEVGFWCLLAETWRKRLYPLTEEKILSNDRLRRGLRLLSYGISPNIYKYPFLFSLSLIPFSPFPSLFISISFSLSVCLSFSLGLSVSYSVCLSLSLAPTSLLSAHERTLTRREMKGKIETPSFKSTYRKSLKDI